MITPGGAIVTNFGPTAFNFNPNLFVLDEAGGRLLLSDDVGGKVWAMTNSTPVPLFNLTQAFPLAVDALGRILAGANDPRLRLYSATGELLNSTFVAAQTNTILARAPGGFWGSDVYFIGTNWNLMRVDTNGVVSQSGTGFGGLNGFAFGPDGALYASQLNSDLIWRIAPDAPRLRIQRDIAAVVVSWPQPASGWNLESTPNLVTTGTNTWTLIPPPYPTNTADHFVTELAPVGNKFYRLRKP
jgi:sugar lactone lactonase YvrE